MNIAILDLYRTRNQGEVIVVDWKVEKNKDNFLSIEVGSTAFTPDPASPNFIPFEQLTEADVIGWLMAKEGWAEALEARLDADIENQKNPPVLHGLPWADEVENEV